MKIKATRCHQVKKNTSVDQNNNSFRAGLSKIMLARLTKQRFDVSK